MSNTIGPWDPREFEKIDASGMGDTEVVAAVAGFRIRVISVLLLAESAVKVKFRSASTDITGPMALDAKGGFSGDARDGLFETEVGEALNINLDTAIQVGGSTSYALLR